MKLCVRIKASFFLIRLFFSIIFFIEKFCRENLEVVIGFEIFRFRSMILRFPVVIDWGGIFFGGAVILISCCVIIFSSFYMDNEVFHSRFVFLVIFFVLSINFLIFIPRLFGLMVGWDGLGVISFLLVIFYQNKRSLGAGIITVLTNRIGDVLLILSICCCGGISSWVFLDLSDWNLPLFIVGIVIVGRITKRAQVPFSAWLPAAIAAPTPVSALVHSSTLVTAGVYVLIRFSSSFWGRWRLFLTVISIFTLIMAGIRARFECDLKKVIALSTLRQLGVIILIISLGSLNLCVFHLVTHALFKALIFICAGAVIHLGSGVQDSRCFSGLWFKLPIVNSWLVVSCLSLIGVPFIAGFYSKDLILEWCLSGDVSLIFRFVLRLGTFLTAFYRVRFIGCIIGRKEFFSFRGFNNLDLSLVISSSVLGVGAIFGGWLFQIILVDFNVFVFITFVAKIRIPVRLVLGLFRSLIMLLLRKTFISRVSFIVLKKSVLRIIRKIWFLPFLSGRNFANPALTNRRKIVAELDLGWIENSFGGLRVSSLINSLRKRNSEAQSRYIGVYFIVGAISFLIFLLFIFR